jgi:hypothetical protein
MAKETPDTTPETIQAAPDQIAEAVAPNPPSDGTVTVDFGNGNVLKGCIIKGIAHIGPNGAEAIVMLPVGEDGYVPLSIPGRYIVK